MPQPYPSSTRQKARIAVGLFAACLLLSSCQSKGSLSGKTRQVTDELGRSVAVVESPGRIVSLAPSVTETLFALGAEGRVIAVTSYCDYPPAAANKEKIGDTQRPNIERIVALRPDLVIASTASQLESFVRALEAAGIPVYVSNPRNLAETLASIRAIGNLIGANDQALVLEGQLRSRIEQVRSRVASKPRPAVFLMLGAEPLLTAGGNSFLTDLLSQAGGRSISEDEKSDYPQYSLETVIARQPEVIFLQAGDERLPNRLEQTPAARQGRVYHIDDDLLLRPGPRIVEALETLAEKIHPY